MCCPTVENGWLISSVVCVEICWGLVHWQRGVGWSGSQGSYLIARTPPWDGNMMGYGSTKSVCPVHLVDGYGSVSLRGRVEKIV